MKKVFLLLSILLCFGCFRYQHIDILGMYEKHGSQDILFSSENGQVLDIRSEYIDADDVKMVQFVSFFSSGSLKSVSNYEEDSSYEIFIEGSFFSLDGKIVSKILDGDGVEVIYDHESGEINQLNCFENGKKTGFFVIYDDSYNVTSLAESNLGIARGWRIDSYEGGNVPKNAQYFDEEGNLNFQATFLPSGAIETSEGSLSSEAKKRISGYAYSDTKKKVIEIDYFFYPDLLLDDPRIEYRIVTGEGVVISPEKRVKGGK